MKLQIRIYFMTLAMIASFNGCDRQKSTPDSHYQAALVLADIEHGPARMTESVMLTFIESNDFQNQTPEMKSIYKDWLKEVYSDKLFLQKIAKIKMKSFNENEIKDIIAFYRTDSGKRFLEAQVHNNTEIQKIGKHNTESHLPSLTSRIQQLQSKANLK